MKTTFSLVLILLVSAACSKKEFREGKFFAGNKYASADVLNLGKTTYQEYCFACHGIDGDGQGVASKGLYPPVRNFKTGVYKFGVVYDGELPHDDTMIRILKDGLKGSAMLPWDISDARANAVVQYIKTFAPEAWEGKDKKLGKKIKLIPDPYGLAHVNTAVKKGAEVYHFTAQCTSCHRGYVNLESYNTLASKLGEDPIESLDEDFYHLKPQDSDYGAQIIPPDFTWHEVRSATSVEEIAYRIAAGVGGVMPTWKEVITDEEIWAVAYYVKSLMDIKNTDQRREFMGNLK